MRQNYSAAQAITMVMCMKRRFIYMKCVYEMTSGKRSPKTSLWRLNTLIINMKTHGSYFM